MRFRFVRPIASLLLLLPLMGAFLACFRLRPVSVDDLRAGNYAKERSIRITYESGVIDLENDWTLDYPWVLGRIEEQKGKPPGELVDAKTKTYRYNLEDARKVELFELNRGKTAVGIGAGAVGLSVVIYVILALAAAALLSCPAVYLQTDAGPARLIGEAFPGATTPAEQREDWLALPPLEGGSRVRLAIRNEHREIQHVDAAGLAFIPHQTQFRALPTPDGSPILVSFDHAARSVMVADTGVGELTRVADGRAWQAVGNGIDMSGRDRIEVDLAANSTDEYALAVTYENTLLYAAAFGVRSATACAPSSLADSANISSCREWRLTEGFDAKVHLTAGTRRETFFLGAAGTEGFRTVAVPLGRLSGRAKVEIESGAGYLRIDRIALARIENRDPSAQRLAAIAATDGSVHLSETLARIDGSYAILSSTGDELRFEFHLPGQSAPGTWFFTSAGYYELQPEVRQKIADLTRR